MKSLISVIVTALTASFCTSASEIYSARCESALTGSTLAKWQIAETKKGLTVVFSEGQRKWSTDLAGEEASAFRELVEELSFTQTDSDILRSLSVTLPGEKKEDELVILRPFDGVTYYFTVIVPGSSRDVWIDNPSFDLDYHQHLEQCDRLKQMLQFLDIIERRAKNEIEPNKTSEVTACSRTSS
ncbi:MAG: hypothetical protein R3F07_14680 [Opitutaceae bacterium]